eukprot:CCRYP_004780-RA/>CCRYP_004780-RA protein AED:0.46 eAED:0.46 QI:0/-1/0/1/-1/1/1/0/89
MGARDSRAVSTACGARDSRCKQMGLDTDLAVAEKAVEAAKIEAELAKQEYATARNAEKKKKGNKQDARHDYRDCFTCPSRSQDHVMTRS